MPTFPPLHDSLGQPAWTLDNGEIALTVTRLGGQMAPVVFRRDGREVRPYFISPWQGEGHADACKLIEPLRGDFFCLPFGGNGMPFRGEVHPPHGESCNNPWACAGITAQGGTMTLALTMETKARAGRVDRRLSLVKNHPAIYSVNTVGGFAGPASFAHHPILAVPETARALKISTSPFAFGMTVPRTYDANQRLARGAAFNDLAQVPLEKSGAADFSAFPVAAAHTDLVTVAEAPGASANTPAWVCAVNTQDHWLWFAFKDPAMMPTRVFWVDTHGRQQAPWLGRVNCLGIEDGCSFFDAGLAESVAPNALSARGIKTALDFPGYPVAIRHIQGALPVPEGFGPVASVVFEREQVVFKDAAGTRIRTPLCHSFLFDGKLP